jgi:hypothetical protein
MNETAEAREAWLINPWSETSETLLDAAGRLDEDRRRWTRGVLAGLPHVSRERCWCGGLHGLWCAWVNLTSWRLRRRLRRRLTSSRP